MASPPIVPIARGYQKDSFDSPTMNGINPKIVERTVSNMGTILILKALIYSLLGMTREYCRRSVLYSLRI